MMDAKREHVRYQCIECKEPQNVYFNEVMKEAYSPKEANGLALYSHVHVCKNGRIGTNNLYIDHNLDVRSYNFVNLPVYEKKKKLLIPGAPKPKNPEVRVTQVMNFNDINIIIKNDMVGVDIVIGTNHTGEPTNKIISSMDMVELQFYKSDMDFSLQVENWLNIFVSSIELLVPSDLGVILEVLCYLIDSKESFPSKLDESAIQVIMASHDVYIFRNNDQITTDFGAIYGDDGKIMNNLCTYLDSNPSVVIHDFLKEFQNLTITQVMFNLQILENHGLIIIEKPGIISM